MEKQDWLKAIKCTKEELIEWLNEMYEDEKIYQDIINKYEKAYNVTIERVQEKFDDEFGKIPKFRSYTRVTAKNFEYKKHWD